MRKIIDWLFRPADPVPASPLFVTYSPVKQKVTFCVNEDKKTAAEHCGNWEPHRAHEWRNSICPDWLLKCGGELD